MSLDASAQPATDSAPASPTYGAPGSHHASFSDDGTSRVNAASSLDGAASSPDDTAALRPGTITLAATPLGNLGDATPRLKAALAEADVIASEDTRRTRQLAQALGVTLRGRVISNFDHNEQSRAADFIDAARRGARVLLVSDAGMPAVSDPGFPLVEAAHDAGIPVTCLPGASAVTTALALSGLRVGRFCFDGFAPRKDGARRQWLQSLVAEQRACCFFESPHRIGSTLTVAAEVLGPARRAAVCRELTKLHEEIRRGTLAELAEWAADGLRGEITVVIEGASADAAAPSLEDLAVQAAELAAGGLRLKEACAQLAAEFGVSKKELYDTCIAAKQAN